MDHSGDWIMKRDAFLESPPPRRVPPEIQRAVAGKGGGLFVALFGLFFILIGSVIGYFIFPTHLPAQWKLEKGPGAVTRGVIQAVEGTNMTINKQPVMKYRFSTRSIEGPGIDGASYTTGGRWNVGEVVEIHYLVADPKVAVIKGARMGPWTAVTLFVAIFPLIGLGFVVGGLLGGRWRKRLLRHGWLSTATVSRIQNTNVQINSQPQFKVHLTRMDDGREMAKRFHRVEDMALLQRKQALREPLKILYDPNKPSRFLLPEAWGS